VAPPTAQNYKLFARKRYLAAGGAVKSTKQANGLLIYPVRFGENMLWLQGESHDGRVRIFFTSLAFVCCPLQLK
jgi:hypothetical protein